MSRHFLTFFFVFLTLAGAALTAVTLLFLVKYADPGRDWVFLCLPLLLLAAGIAGLCLGKRKKPAEHEPDENSSIE